MSTLPLLRRSWNWYIRHEYTLFGNICVGQMFYYLGLWYKKTDTTKRGWFRKSNAQGYYDSNIITYLGPTTPIWIPTHQALEDIDK